MKNKRIFWALVFASLALTVIGYFGAEALNPDKTTGGVIALFFLCWAMVGIGVLVLIGVFVYAAVRLVLERRSKTAPLNIES